MAAHAPHRYRMYDIAGAHSFQLASCRLRIQSLENKTLLRIYGFELGAGWKGGGARRGSANQNVAGTPTNEISSSNLFIEDRKELLSGNESITCSRDSQARRLVRSWTRWRSRDARCV